MDHPWLLVGADVGESSTKVAIVDHEGVLLGYSVELGGNIRSFPGSLTENLCRALTLAVPSERRTDIVGGILGIAGGRATRAAEVSQIARQATELCQETDRSHTGPDSTSVDPRQKRVRALDHQPASRLGRFAPPTAAAATVGDDVACRIVAGAANALVRTGTHSAHGREVTEVTLAGSVLTTAGPVRDAVRLGLAQHFAATCTEVHSPVVGAIVLAARAADWTLDRVAVVATAHLACRQHRTVS
jgi:N-acetylglucosamine kinase-like BadF-type ATPase